ncbi:DEAD-box ATP-dependent RNA helicase 52C [Sesamum alatum]|uniref:RNA helicase n=1 Tax=Sesamum alatum TaxID=300844 RepID=A0AAE1XY69_9LAMI|nr:DEAD-box ATP-dependent RNA helicase 52C [Sesamum alatum]
MSRPWFTDSRTASTPQTVPKRSTFVPPRHRTEPDIIVTIPPQYVRGVGRLRQNVCDTFDISEKTDELLGVTSQEEKSEKQDVAAAYDDVPVEATGLDIPPHVTSFEEMGFSTNALTDNIRRCKYVKPTPIQSYAIPVAMAGRDLMACAQTGSGKTAAFCFPIINGVMGIQRRKRLVNHSAAASSIACPVALILAPTRELSCQIHEVAKKFSYQTGVKVVVAYGGASVVQQLRNLEKGVDILVATPGRLVDLIERGKISLRNVKYLALDEADRMLDMGFERQVRRIVQQMEMPQPGARQTMLFSATFPVEIQRLASDFLSNYIFLAAGKVGSSTDLIIQRVEFVPDVDKRDHLVNLLRSGKTTKTPSKDALTLVFVETKRGADALECWLSRKGFPSTAIHGDKIQMERERALRSFRSGRTPILVATDVAARGLDIPHVAHVINFDLPRAVDDYVHRIGRTGRAGKSGLATAFFSEKNAPLAKALVDLMQETNQEIPEWLNDYANAAYTVGGSGRSSSHGYSKFGGCDYRSGVGCKNSDDYQSQHAPYAAYNDPTTSTSDPIAYNLPYAADNSAPTADSYGLGPYGCLYDGGTVATGWE